MLRVAEHHADTNTGRQRRGNEDAFFARAPLFAVADGMGGAQAGEVASGTAIEVLGDGIAEGASSAEERLVALIVEANDRIHQLSVRDRERAGMGTTVTAAYVGERDVALAHVGDSRAYRLRDGSLERLTDDHSLVEEFVRQGKLTPAEADEHPQRSIITRALGPEPEIEVDRMSVGSRAGDVFLLCTDGLTTMVAEPRVAEIVLAADSLAAAARQLIEAANAAGGRDNVTVVLFRLEDVEATVRSHDQDTAADAAALSAAEVRAAVASAPPSAASATRRREARAPRAQPRPRRRLRRWLGPVAIALIVCVPLLGGAYLATQAVYFLGVDDNGAVTVFRGLPYELPAGIELYRTEYVTGLTPSQLPAGRRAALLDHKLRSHDDARDLARQLELGQLAGR